MNSNQGFISNKKSNLITYLLHPHYLVTLGSSVCSEYNKQILCRSLNFW